MNAIPSTAADETVDRVIKEKTAYWQQAAPAINHLNNSGTRPRGVFLPVADKMLSFIPPKSRVLDVGCGHGRMSIPLADAGHKVVATDVSAKMLELLETAKGDLPIEVRLGDAHRLAAADGEFDVVTSTDFMPHFPDWPRLLAEKARACREGGLIIFAFNFTEHRSFAEPFGSNHFEHPYSPDPQSPKPFWAECSLEFMLETLEKNGLKLNTIVPLKFLHDNIAIGGALGTDEYRAFQAELSERLLRDPAAAEFFRWLESRLFQRLPFFASYLSLLVIEKRRTPPIETTASPSISIVKLPAYSTQAPSTPIPIAPRPAEANPQRFLSEIPSETTPGERTLLYRLFCETWNGADHVIEIGPFLGGTTRAIALGMMDNPHRSPAARLHTFDRFGDYYTPADLKRMIQPLVTNGTFSEAKAEQLSEAGDFLGIFNAIHQSHPYAALIEAHNSPLPDFPEELKTSHALDKLLDQGPLGALFIDGCKSWASTLFAMKFLLPRTTPHARLIFQDFGWYTCFWISSFVYSLRDILVAHERIDATYVFSLNRPVTEAEIERRFAPTPDAMGAQFFKDACIHLMKESIARKDVRGALIAQLHFVAALATIGRKADALNLLNTINPKDYGGLASLIAGSRKSPTYRPGNKPILWTE